MSIKTIKIFLFLECWKLDKFFKQKTPIRFLLLAIPIKFVTLNSANVKLTNTFHTSTMKRTNLLYWIITGIFAAFMLFSAVPDVMMHPNAVTFMNH